MRKSIMITSDNILRVNWLIRCDAQFEDRTQEEVINNILTEYIEKRGFEQEIRDAEERRKNRQKRMETIGEF